MPLWFPDSSLSPFLFVNLDEDATREFQSAPGHDSPPALVNDLICADGTVSLRLSTMRPNPSLQR